MPASRLLSIAVFGLLLFPAARAMADAASDRAEFDKTYAHFRDLLDQCGQLQSSFAAAAPSDRKALEDKFNALVHEGNEMRPKLKAQAEKVYVADPKDHKIADLMYAMVDRLDAGRRI